MHLFDAEAGAAPFQKKKIHLCLSVCSSGQNMELLVALSFQTSNRML
jgi:hypothetical protein